MNWLTQSWHELLGQPWANLALALVAVICGSIVGAERERKEKPAGLRTLTLVSLGSAVFTMVSISFSHGDPGRIASQIVTGIGFLGAGAILRGQAGITGMTTAATIWIMAAVGMVAGAGYAVASLALSLLVVGVLTVISTLEKKYLGHCEFSSVLVTFDPAGGKSVVKIEEILEDHHVQRGPMDLSTASDGMKQLRLNYCHAHRHHREFLTSLAALPEVREIRREPPSSSAT
ncbi:MAG: MgtC/SapB family protein [Verrucomicrobia bacterium]|nr:MgtC/SapB family protein [Verrucomicrobiota bacterium]